MSLGRGLGLRSDGTFEKPNTNISSENKGSGGGGKGGEGRGSGPEEIHPSPIFVDYIIIRMNTVCPFLGDDLTVTTL